MTEWLTQGAVWGCAVLFVAFLAGWITARMEKPEPSWESERLDFSRLEAALSRQRELLRGLDEFSRERVAGADELDSREGGSSLVPGSGPRNSAREGRPPSLESELTVPVGIGRREAGEGKSDGGIGARATSQGVGVLAPLQREKR